MTKKSSAAVSVIPNSIEAFILPQNAAVRDVIRFLDVGGRGIALVVDSQGRLLDTLTDGDIRRALLRGVTVDASARDIKAAPGKPPVVAPADTNDAEAMHIMKTNKLRHLPLVDAEMHVVEVKLLSELLARSAEAVKKPMFRRRATDSPQRALVVAGGYGTRLYPLTKNIPKPMLPVQGKPLLEIIVQKLQKAGIQQVLLSTHYKSNVIQEHFGNGENHGLRIDYVTEKEPLGTAGSLSLIDAGENPILVMNADILSDIDFNAMREFHVEEHADLTMAVRTHKMTIPFGVIECKGTLVTAIREKPQTTHFINAGIYLISPRLLSLLPKGEHVDMPEFIESLMKQKYRVVGFPIHESWIDIGRHEDYESVK